MSRPQCICRWIWKLIPLHDRSVAIQVPAPPVARPTTRELLFEERYRRRFLRSDIQVNVVAMPIVGLALAAAIVNDFLLYGPGLLRVTAVAAKVLLAIISVAAAIGLASVRRSRQYDVITTGWLLGFSALNIVINVTRIPSGQYQGPVLSAGLTTAIFAFAMRGPLWPRLVAFTTAILLALVLVWNPGAIASSVVRNATTIGLLAFGLLALFVARSAEAQRRSQFSAEQKEKQARRELSQKLRELAAEKERTEATSRVRTAFLATMSHEFRTPMNAVIGLSDLLLEEPLEQRHREHVQTIRESARGLLGILNDILDFTKIDLEKLVLSPVAFELHKLATSVIAMLRPSAEQRGIVLRLAPTPESQCWLLGDDVRLRQVLVNLLSNAIKFTERGHVELRITSQPHADSSDVRRVSVQVQDTGIGIAPQVLPRLFRPFEQADPGTTRRYGGSGLGLHISRQLIRAMGSDISVQSRLGEGSIFSFELMLPVAAPPPQLVPAARGAPGRASSAAGLRVLVVDDEPLNRLVAHHKLSRLGHRVDCVPNGEAALAVAKDGAYELVLMDLQLPGLSGIETTRRLLGEPHSKRSPHVIALSASVHEEDRRACLQAGMCDFLDKPIDDPQLEAALLRVQSERTAAGA